MSAYLDDHEACSSELDLDIPLLENTEELRPYDEFSRRRAINERDWRNRWEMNYQEAAIYLKEGEDNEKFDTHPQSQDALPAYILVHRTWYKLLETFASLLLLSLALCEAPAVPYLEAPESIHGSLELFGLLILALTHAMKIRWLGIRRFFVHTRTLIKTITLVVMFVEAIVVLIRQTSHLRVTRALRPIFIIDTHYVKGVRRVLRQIFQSLPPILDMLGLLLFFMLIFAIMAFYLFSTDPDNYYFSTFDDCFVNLFILLTTANFPDVMMPAYNRSRWSAIFFIVYLIVELYFLMNLLLAVVYETFTNIEKNKFKSLLLHKRKASSLAFRLLCSRQNPGKITFAHFCGLMRFFRPAMSQRDVLLAFKVLNTSETGLVPLSEFYSVFAVASLQWDLHRPERTHWFDRLPRPLRRTLTAIHRLVTSKAFEGFIYVVITVNGVWILVDTILISKDVTHSAPDAFDIKDKWYHIIFLSIYTIEAILKMLGLGIKGYFKSKWNWFDFAVTVTAIIGILGELFYNSFYYVLILRPIRLLRLFKLKRRFRDVLGAFLVLLPRMSSVAVVILVMYYFFGIIGMEFFANIPLENCCKNTTIEDFYAIDKDILLDQYFYLNNFDNILLTYVTLFELMVVNNWHVIMYGISQVTSKWSQIYFMLFHVASMVVITIIIAFILEAFLFRIQYRKETSNDETQEEDIENSTVEIIVSLNRRELLSHYPIHKQDLELLQLIQKLIDVDLIFFKGERSQTKEDLNLNLYKNEVVKWVEEEKTKSRVELHSFLRRCTQVNLTVNPAASDARVTVEAADSQRQTSDARVTVDAADSHQSQQGGELDSHPV